MQNQEKRSRFEKTNKLKIREQGTSVKDVERKLDYKDFKETKIPSIIWVSKDDSVVYKNDFHYDEKKDEDVKEYTDGDDEEVYNYDGGTKK